MLSRRAVFRAVEDVMRYLGRGLIGWMGAAESLMAELHA